MLRHFALTAIGLGFVALSVLPMAMGEMPWTSPNPWSGMLFFAGCAVVGLSDIVQHFRPPRASVEPTRVALTYDRTRLLPLGLASAGWLGSGIIGLLGTMFPVWLAWVLIAFGGLCTAFLIPSGLDGRAKVTVDAEGIADYRQASHKIAWSEIEAISYGSLRGMTAISLKLRNPARLERRLFARLFGYPGDPVQIIAFNLAGSLGDIAEGIRRFAPPALWELPEDIEHFDQDDAADDGDAL